MRYIAGPPNTFFFKVYAINLDYVNFDKASFTFVSTGDSVWKCKNWSFSERKCSDNNWEKWMETTPGAEYTLELGPGDPGIAMSGRDRGLVAYYGNDSGNSFLAPAYNNWTGTAWSSKGFAGALSTGSDTEWVRVKCSPQGYYCILATLDDLGEVQAQTWANNTWGTLKKIAANIGTTNDASQGFDVVWEYTRGWGMVISANASANPWYAIWYPENQTWSAVGTLGDGTDSCTGIPLWIEASQQKAFTAQVGTGGGGIITVYRDDAGDLCAYDWDGSGWVNEKSIFNTTTSETVQKTFCLETEQTSGEPIVFFETTATAGNVTYCSRSGGTWCTTTALPTGSAFGSAIVWMECAAMPGDNRVMMATVDAQSSDDLDMWEWSGTAMGTNTGTGTSAFDASIEDDVTNRQVFDVAYLGESGSAMVVYANDINFPSYAICLGATGCSNGSTGWYPVADSGATTGTTCGGTASQVDLHRLVGDPYSNDTMLIYGTQTASEPKCAQQYNATSATWSAVTLLIQGQVFLAGTRDFNFDFYRYNQKPWHNGTTGGAYPGPAWYDSDSTNSSPYAGTTLTLSSFWQDDIALSYYTMEWNASGSFANVTPWTKFADLNNSWGNITVTIPASAEGKVVSARIWANDSQDLENVTNNYANITVQNYTPLVNPVFGNFTNLSNINTNSWVCVNATVTDKGSAENVWVTVTYPNATVFNLTLRNSSTNNDCQPALDLQGRWFWAKMGVGDTAGTMSFGGEGPSVSKAWYANDTVPNYGVNATNWTLNVVVPVIPAQLKIAQFRLWRNPTTVIGNGSTDPSDYDFLACNYTSAFGSNVNDPAELGLGCNNTSPYGATYRAEIRLCNDGPSGADTAIFITANHISLSSQYLGALTDCGSGNNGSTWAGTTCATYTGSDGLPVVAINGNAPIPSGDGSTRTDTNCDYYAYRFTTGNPDWIVTDRSTINTSGVTSGTNPTSGIVSVNTTYSETAFALFYPASGCNAGQGAEARTRPRYYNETCTTAHGCDPQNATFENWNDTTNYAVDKQGADKLFYNFTDVQTAAGNIYWTLETIGPASGEIHAWDYSTSKWVQLGRAASIGVPVTVVTPVNTTYGTSVSLGGLNLTFNITAGSQLRIYDVYYEGNHTSKCVRCYASTADPNAKNVACEGQTGGGLSGTAFFDLQNLGSVIESWKVFVDSAMPSGITFQLNDSSATNVVLSTSPQTFNSSVEFFEHAYAWAWANFTNVGATILPNERKLTSNTSWK
jgi:hypothetical protein